MNSNLDQLFDALQKSARALRAQTASLRCSDVARVLVTQFAILKGPAADPLAYPRMLARALAGAGYSAGEIASALVSPGVFPSLSALQVGTVLLDPQVCPNLSAADMAAALLGAGFSQNDVASAVRQLYGSAPVRLGPVGNPTPGELFDDSAASAGLGAVTGLTIRCGNILDSIQALYSSAILPAHGGWGGDETTVMFAPGDYLLALDVVTGFWLTGTFVLQILAITGAGKQYGPFGTLANTSDPQAVSLAAPSGAPITALFGGLDEASEYGGRISSYVSQLGLVATATDGRVIARSSR